MGATKITYVTDEDNGEYAAIYIDGKLVLDCQTYELDAYQAFMLLKNQGLLDAEIERKTIEFFTHVEFPDNLSEIK